MAKYLVTYDLVGTDETSEDYKRLIKKIKSYSHLELQYSGWLIKSDADSKAIFDDLLSYLDPNDRLMLVQLDGTAWWVRDAIDGGTEAAGNFIRS